MTPRKFTMFLAAAALVATATTARAAEEAANDPFGGRAPYFSAGGVFAIENDSHFTGGLSNSGGYDIRAGYEVHDMVALELQWQSLVSFSRNSVDSVTGQSDPSVEARMLSLNGRVSPLEGRFQPYGLFGMGWYNVQADRVANNLHESSFAMRFGLGLATFITNNFGFTLEAGYILPLSGNLGGGDRFDIIPITGMFFYRFR